MDKTHEVIQLAKLEKKIMGWSINATYDAMREIFEKKTDVSVDWESLYIVLIEEFLDEHPRMFTKSELFDLAMQCKACLGSPTEIICGDATEHLYTPWLLKAIKIRLCQ